MSNHSIIYLSNDNLVIYRWEKNRLIEDIQLYNPDNSGEALQEYFNTKSDGQPIKIVLDILEETYALESLPHLNYRDRQAMIDRKQKQLYPRLNFVHQQYKGRGNSERRDDLVLFAAITEEQIIKQWLQLLYELQVSISGIYSLPILLEALSSQLKGKKNKLVISLLTNKHGTFLRQSFFQDNMLALSRFRQINSFDVINLAEEIKEDVNRSQRFIARHFSVSGDDNLSVYFFGSGSDSEALFKQINFSTISLSPSLIISQEFAHLQGKKIDKATGISVYIAAQLAKKHFIKPHYKDTQSQFYYHHHLIKKTLNYASVFIVLLTVCYLSFSLNDNAKINNELDILHSQKRNLVNKLANTPEAPNFKGFNAFQLFNQLKTKNKIEQQKVSSQAVLENISHALSAYPEITLLKLEWGKKSDQQSLLEDDEYIDTTLDSAINIDPVQAKPLTITLQAKIEPFKGDYRRALLLIDNFSQSLANQVKIQDVQATELPVNLSTDNELSGATKRNISNSTFILQLNWLR